ncbi:MAG: phage Gp37/Gp68 family protein [Rhodocyclaceae bacterium]|nr:phage Gp37/Gp68 family protein [Rhodocyclaceae bacterium]
MGANSSIEWTDHTFNPWIGCTKVSPGCDHCYAERDFDLRKHRVKWGAGNPRSRTGAANWKLPRRWNAEAARTETRRRVFCASLADVFDNEVPPEWRVDLLRLIADTPWLDWLLLTKRIGNADRMMTEAFHAGWPAHGWVKSWSYCVRNVWIGATVVNQTEADRDIQKLLATPAAVRFLSIEPMLGPIDLRNIAVPTEHDVLRRPWDTDGFKFNSLQSHDDERFHQTPSSLDWVICGGESGPQARPIHPQWVMSLRDQCRVSGVPFFFKQWGEWLPWLDFSTAHIPDDSDQTRYETVIWQDDEWENCGRPQWCDVDDWYGGGAVDPEGRDQIMGRVGKRLAGRLLAGVTHSEFPVS